jgi:hypothetical protein
MWLVMHILVEEMGFTWVLLTENNFQNVINLVLLMHTSQKGDNWIFNEGNLKFLANNN